MKKKNYDAQTRYRKKYQIAFHLACYTSTEQDIIDWLKSKENKSGYIKKLIREDILKSTKNQ